MSNFTTLGVNPKLTQILKDSGIVQPTPIQEKAIPVLLAKRDVIAQAQTGTGKTLAFVLPILEMIDPKKQSIQALIITPTRELAIQITSEVKKIIEHLEDIHVLPVYGGQDVDRQMRKLKGANQIVIGTPGRILDHMGRGTINLSTISFLVLDEADQMLHMGFLTDVQRIIEATPYHKQTILTSATMPGQIRTLAKQYMIKPEEILIKAAQVTVKETKQWVIETTDRKKLETLHQLLDQHRPYLAMIFCRTKQRASALNTNLISLGYESDELHGDLSQAKREDVMKRFRQAKLQLLVATDVAARGLDVEGVTHVFNYDIPHDVESYIHRIGRTGRAGGKGVAITLVTPKDRKYLVLIEKGLKTPLEKEKSMEQHLLAKIPPFERRESYFKGIYLQE
ncbi:DEAD/DEAH box helicase [Tepidibacillus marianensis]|uniref:DEAD/DEAH box helicase n=1 Tax=Tepidibacillus marianensis TaxID=3131995 RepID=UPI0030CEFF64